MEIQENLVNKIDAEKYLDKFQKELLEVDINKLTPNIWNPNRHGAESFETLKNSIKKFGFNDPVSVRQVVDGVNEYDIIDGEHRWRAAKELRFTKIAVINFGEITKEEAMTLTQLLNHKGKDDVLLRAKLLKQLQSQSSLFSLLPGSDKDKEEELKLLDFDFSQFESVEGEEVEQKKDDLEQAKKKAIELQIILDRIHEVSKNTKLRTAIELFRDFVRMLKSYIPD